MWIDSHCHLDQLEEKFLQCVIKYSKVIGIRYFICPAVDIDSSYKTLKMSLLQPIYACVGIHPYHIHIDNVDDELKKINKIVCKYKNKIVAIGEIGLDKLKGPSLDVQVKVLTYQIKLALEYKLPVILHSVRTHHLLYPILKKIKPSKRGVVHSFIGNYHQAMAFVKEGYYIGVSPISFKSKKTMHAISLLPLGSIVIETDVPISNNPTIYPLTCVFENLRNIRKESAFELLKTTFESTLRLFSI